jgi:hypothetical protein
MKTNQTEANKSKLTAAGKFVGTCLAGCQKLVARIQKAKESILAEFRETRETHNRLLRLAVVEAEALAWQTEFPHLVFPTLAREKAEEIAKWEARQFAIQRPLQLAA